MIWVNMLNFDSNKSGKSSDYGDSGGSGGSGKSGESCGSILIMFILLNIDKDCQSSNIN